ncbi:class I SAM-dependent methyltransferase [Fluoribacter gormanii]|uniref:Methyltransferase domain-containing protein n=1 Tax=Fluoribacter gormanii TaxID=464 RepID=A0A377GGQ5_9GAMM|nr:class I SAM-dependent methyltransferase [Fluoribacter gormanii]KTD02282.1 O-methyltransferase [Fluoribacter gormanii]MCW8444470.1 class I SAM-dependent methyltransferase [Fluoribacter gormanii]MCW8469663.1 class I SAM-dependent methyltransferase [Fluoribacter gormanii]SIR27776.1 Methyltransferase domain-containing protein [Fluoribacter gormanii]STO24009.1 Phthiotriol/phenolphthiotriol dimycocerosates methyltransferase [Fluoribacter gormanii]
MTENNIKTYGQALKQIRSLMRRVTLHSSEVKLIKNQIQESYTSFAHIIFDTSFLNWGLWNKRIYKEYAALNFDFSKICTIQDIYSPLLVFYLIRPLVKMQFFDKKLLEIGCGNGIGLRVSSELLKTKYALGVDLTKELVNHAHHNFYKENKINYIQSDAECLPFANNSFDIITNLESSHLYPQIDLFFSEVERVLSPNGFFCYSDLNISGKLQAKRLEEYLKARNTLKVIQKVDITRMVQSAIYHRLILNEKKILPYIYSMLDDDENGMGSELSDFVGSMGLAFLPWWFFLFKKSALSHIAKKERKKTVIYGKKLYFYYLIQKVNQ